MKYIFVVSVPDSWEADTAFEAIQGADLDSANGPFVDSLLLPDWTPPNSVTYGLCATTGSIPNIRQKIYNVGGDSFNQIRVVQLTDADIANEAYTRRDLKQIEDFIRKVFTALGAGVDIAGIRRRDDSDTDSDIDSD
ncbi:hypothetical protein GCM10027093_73660 [Paraburkholderia jirisanensis]